MNVLAKKKVMEFLIDAEMPFSEFEDYYKHLQTISNSDVLGDFSSETLKK